MNIKPSKVSDMVGSSKRGTRKRYTVLQNTLDPTKHRLHGHGETMPLGFEAVFGPGTRQECLNYIQEQENPTTEEVEGD